MRNPIGCEVCGTRDCDGCGQNVIDGALCCGCKWGISWVCPECGGLPSDAIPCPVCATFDLDDVIGAE